jgi:hypothetical protein
MVEGSVTMNCIDLRFMKRMRDEVAIRWIESLEATAATR